MLNWSFVTPCKSQSTESDYFYVSTDGKEDLDIGIRMGVGVNTFAGNKLIDPLPLLRFNGGIYHRIPITKNKVSLYYELSASFKGARFNASGDSAIERFALTYFDLPVGLDYAFLYQESAVVDAKPLVLRGFIGLQPSLLLRSTMFLNAGDRQGRQFSLPFNTFDLALIAGVLYDFPIGYGKMGLSSFIKYGLVNIDKDLDFFKPDPNFSDGNFVNNLQITFNISF